MVQCSIVNHMVQLKHPVLIVAAALVAAVAINLAIYLVGGALGATYQFTNAGQALEVDRLTLVGFTSVPLAVGLTLAAVLGRIRRVFYRIALVVGPVFAVSTIAIMTVPTDLSLASKITLGLCHVALVPVMVAALLALSHRKPS